MIRVGTKTKILMNSVETGTFFFDFVIYVIHHWVNGEENHSMKPRDKVRRLTEGWQSALHYLILPILLKCSHFYLIA